MVTCGLTACTPGSAPGPVLGIEYEKPLPFTFFYVLVCQLRVRKLIWHVRTHSSTKMENVLENFRAEKQVVIVAVAASK